MTTFSFVRLEAGDIVPRDDGRFYVPIRDLNRPDELSAVVCRVSSDAFDTVEEAQAFAAAVAQCWNYHGRGPWSDD